MHLLVGEDEDGSDLLELRGRFAVKRGKGDSGGFVGVEHTK